MAEDGAWGFGKGRRRISIEVRWLWLLVHCARAQQGSVLSRLLLLCTCLEWSFSAPCDSLGQTSGA
jgi:hypothetical protein